MRPIDADEVQKIIDYIRVKYGERNNDQFFWNTIRYIEKKVRSIPTIEAVPVVHGEWVTDESCSICGCSYMDYADCDAYRDFRHPLPNYCPNCGAKMDKKAD